MNDNQPEPIQESKEAEKKDRTAEQFDKLTESNKNLNNENVSLKEELDKYKRLYEAPTNQVPDATKYSNLNQEQVNDVFAGMVDQNGFLDGNKLAETLQDMNNRATEAERRAKIAELSNQELSKKFNDKEEKEAQKEVYKKYPQLNPEDKESFDPKMWRAVYNELAVKAKAGEMPSENDYLNAADQVYQDFYSEKDMNKQEKEIKEEKEAQKEQINAVKPTSNMQAGFYANLEENDLIQKIQEGKRGSIAELLNRRGQ